MSDGNGLILRELFHFLSLCWHIYKVIKLLPVKLSLDKYKL